MFPQHAHPLTCLNHVVLPATGLDILWLCLQREDSLGTYVNPLFKAKELYSSLYSVLPLLPSSPPTLKQIMTICTAIPEIGSARSHQTLALADVPWDGLAAAAAAVERLERVTLTKIFFHALSWDVSSSMFMSHLPFCATEHALYSFFFLKWGAIAAAITLPLQQGYSHFRPLHIDCIVHLCLCIRICRANPKVIGSFLGLTIWKR